MPRQLGPTMRIFFARFAENILLDGRAAIADFLETGGDDDRAFDACRNALADHLGDSAGRCRDYRQLDLFRNLAQAGIAR